MEINKTEAIRIVNSDLNDEEKIEALQDMGMELEDIFVFILDNFK